MDKAQQLFQELAQKYPRDGGWWWVRLGGVYRNLGQLEKCLDVSQRALSEDRGKSSVPRQAGYYFAAINAERRLGHFSEAHKTSNLAASRGLDHAYLRRALYWLAFVEGDTKGMAEQVTWFDGKPPDIQHSMLSEEANTEAYRGHVRAAREFARRAVDAVARGGNMETAASYHLDVGWREAVFGNAAEAHKEATVALALAPESEDVKSQAAELLARTGDADSDIPILKQAKAEYAKLR